MKVLRILSLIWKSGADIYLDKQDDRVAIKNQNLIPAEVMQAAEQHFADIDKWFKSWKNESGVRITMMKMTHQICGWQQNAGITAWISADNEAMMLFDKWMILLAENGWSDIYEDFRQFEHKESDALAQELYERAMAFAKKGV